jgi:hypothetical protein
MSEVSTKTSFGERFVAGAAKHTAEGGKLSRANILKSIQEGSGEFLGKAKGFIKNVFKYSFNMDLLKDVMKQSNTRTPRSHCTCCRSCCWYWCSRYGW